MERRIPARSNNISIPWWAKNGSHGYGFIEVRWFDPAKIYVSLDADGRVYEIDSSHVEEGPALSRFDGPRGICDEQPMMYARENGIRFLYQSKLRPSCANKKQSFTEKNRQLEEAMVREYVQWRGGEYLSPIKFEDDGGMEIC
jgi:hypothetical protein